jgi:hypothetical protein
MTRIRVENRKELHWPPWKCACCGGEIENIETATLVVYKKREEHITRKWQQAVPSCELCRKHQQIAAGVGDWYGIGCLVVFLAVAFAFGRDVVYSLLWFVVTEAVCVGGYLALWSRWSKRDKLNAKEFMKPDCTGATFVTYRREPPELFPKTFADIFTFANDAYAAEFSELNGGKRE